MDMTFTDEFVKLNVVDPIAENAAGLGGGIDLKLKLIINDFSPSKSLTMTDLLFWTQGMGLNEKTYALGNAILVWNPESGVWGYQLNEPAGGLNFVATGVPEAGVLFYGVALVQNEGAYLMATYRFDTPVEITNVGQYIPIDAVIGFLTDPPIGV